ncbi:acyltransferase family protein [Flavobacterium humi]|uniref:Acyltransferase n=1 Tax=Flavobacterium humi TaxID=2562683 RepID=A0A4Z0L6H8_9FLAO|nr:acyltransferase [Flavobacterium humi]TGD57161.1 acyltransferase [Flavobacterium humi]
MNKEITKRIPSLDGLRAISILLVIYDHAFRPSLLNVGYLGVTIFFVISSYLIIQILLRDIEKNRFSVKMFYFKRIFRIFPAYYTYLGVLFLVLSFLGLFKWSQFWRAPFFLVNYQPRSDWAFPQWFVGHTWSLAVEEQFYILIALLFIFVNKKILGKGKLLLILIGIILIVPLIRVSYLYFDCIPDILKGSNHRSFETVADALAVGGILAIKGNDLKNHKWFPFFKNKVGFLVLIVLLMMLLNSPDVVAMFGLKPRYLYNLVGLTTINICVGIIIMVLVHSSKESLLSGLLNHKIMTTIGLWSYSIYLWQQIWLYSWDFPLVFKCIGILLCSVASYYLVEVKFLNWRDAFLKRNEKL